MLGGTSMLAKPHGVPAAEQCLSRSDGLHTGSGTSLMLWRQTTTPVLRECVPAAAIWETAEAVWTLCKSRLEQQPRWVALAGFTGLCWDDHAALCKVHSSYTVCEGTS